MRILLLKLLFIFICIFVLTYNQSDLSEYIIKTQKQDIIVNVKSKEGSQKVKLDDYLFGVVAGEMPLHFEIEALKAQVVASRTFVLSRKLNVDNTTNTQVYLNEKEAKKKWGKLFTEYSKKIKKAIDETNNEVLMYKGDYISALFFSSSNGKTNNCSDYFEGGKPYLKSVDSHWDNISDPHNKNKYSFTREELSALLDIDIKEIKLENYENGYVKDVYINDKVISGRKVREMLNLASSSFDIVVDDDLYTFITYGKGHGVGMSQYGAQAMAKEGYDYKDILNHYYNNVDIVSID